ncbi:MAG: type II toxin-antitoxin system VapC family toxin [Saccharofermentans sp.]|nr:type II toxin-antitoxin system VapC family toxin [Saccharofermentans sp.]
MYLLDTVICSYALKGTYPEVIKRLLTIDPDDILVSCITVSEFEYGASRRNWGDKNRQMINAFLANYRVLPFNENDALLLGRVRAQHEALGHVVGLLDLMIGSQAVNNDLVLVTHNTKDFVDIPGIKLEDWVDER